MRIRDILAVVGCLLIPAGLGLVSESPILIFGQDVAWLGGWVLIAGGVAVSASVLVSAAWEAIIDRAPPTSHEPSVDAADREG